jgi:TPP-dependent pyruvate/acetoin dehydrogenase alpha subunit
MRALFAELMGKLTGISGGRGGSQHLHWGNFYSNGVLGGTVPVAAGMALAEKIKQSGALTISFLGDGTLGEGVVYETLNMTSLWSVPILFVLENNRLAQTTPIERHLAGNIRARFEAFGISTEEIDSSDVLSIRSLAATAIDGVREGARPRALIIHTHRFGPHSKGDDTRPRDEIEFLRTSYDPLGIHAVRISPSEREEIESGVKSEVLAAFKQAAEDPIPRVENLPPPA